MAYLYIDVQVNIQLFNHLYSIYVNMQFYVIHLYVKVWVYCEIPILLWVLNLRVLDFFEFRNSLFFEIVTPWFLSDPGLIIVHFIIQTIIDLVLEDEDANYELFMTLLLILMFRQ